MKIHKSQSGFSPVHILLLLVLVGIIGFAGWKVYDAGKSNKPADSSTTAPAAANTEAKAEVNKIPEGFAEYRNDELGLKFAYPKEWGQFEKTEFSSENLFQAGFSSTKAESAVTGQPGYNVGFYAKTGKEGIPQRGGALWDCVGFVLKDQKYTCRNIYTKDGASVERNDSVLTDPRLIKGRNTDTVIASYEFFGQPVFAGFINLKGQFYGGVFVTDSTNPTFVKQLEQVVLTMEVL